MRCPACGATNPDAAAWCGQCYRRFDEPQTTSAGGNGQDTPGAAAGHTPAAGESAAGRGATGFRRDGDDLLWECPQCNAENSIDLQSCAVCGTSFLQRFASDAAEPPRNWPRALAMSALAPGAGHIAVGRHGSGIARLMLFFSWGLGAVLLLSQGAGTAAVATPLLLGALAVWIGSLVDLLRVQHGQSEFLVGRTLLWLVVGVLGLLALGLFAVTGSSVPLGA